MHAELASSACMCQHYGLGHRTNVYERTGCSRHTIYLAACIQLLRMKKGAVRASVAVMPGL